MVEINVLSWKIYLRNREFTGV